jgi:hypothetical protein
MRDAPVAEAEAKYPIFSDACSRSMDTNNPRLIIM